MNTNNAPSEKQVEQMRREVRAIIGTYRAKPHSINYKTIGEHFGVSRSTVNNAINYRAGFKHLALLSVIHAWLTEKFGAGCTPHQQ